MVVAPVSWQVGSLPSDIVIAVGVPTVEVTFTVLVTGGEVGPLQPFAVTCMSTLPEKPFAQVITPEEFIDPAAGLLNDQLKPVLFEAVVE